MVLDCVHNDETPAYLANQYNTLSVACSSSYNLVQQFTQLLVKVDAKLRNDFDASAPAYCLARLSGRLAKGIKLES